VVCFTSSSTFIKIIDQQGWCPLKNVIAFNCLKLMFKTTQEQLDVENPCSNHTKKMSQFGLLLPRRKKTGAGMDGNKTKPRHPAFQILQHEFPWINLHLLEHFNLVGGTSGAKTVPSAQVSRLQKF
jgi:hypothetical protein